MELSRTLHLSRKYRLNYTKSRKFPKELIVGLNKRDPRYHDLYRINIETGNITLVQNNSEGFSTYRVDENYSIRLAQKMISDGGKPDLQGKRKRRLGSLPKDSYGGRPDHLYTRIQSD